MCEMKPYNQAKHHIFFAVNSLIQQINNYWLYVKNSFRGIAIISLLSDLMHLLDKIL